MSISKEDLDGMELQLDSRLKLTTQEQRALIEEVRYLRKVRLCTHHYDGPTDEDFGGDGCVICVMNARDIAQSRVRVLVRDANILLDAVKEAVEVIDALAGQQAMPDDFYVSPLAYFTGLSKSDPYKE